MTLSQTAITPMGIVLTADSRQTYLNNASMTRIGTDSAVKIFELTKKTGVVISGRSSFPDPKTSPKNVYKNTGWFIEEFRKELLNKKRPLSVKEIAQGLNKYLTKNFFNPEKKRVGDLLKEEVLKKGGTNFNIESFENLTFIYSFKKDGKKVKEEFRMETIGLIVAGYDPDGVGRAYLVYIPNEIDERISRNTEVGGYLRIGQDDVVTRILHGWDINALSIEFVKESIKKGVPVVDELNKLYYIINWGIMTIQDATDFCVLMTRMTESVQRFSDGTYMSPGGIPGVGGAIDVAIITPEKGFEWISKKELVIKND